MVRSIMNMMHKLVTHHLTMPETGLPLGFSSGYYLTRTVRSDEAELCDAVDQRRKSSRSQMSSRSCLL